MIHRPGRYVVRVKDQYGPVDEFVCRSFDKACDYWNLMSAVVRRHGYIMYIEDLWYHNDRKDTMYD